MSNPIARRPTAANRRNATTVRVQGKRRRVPGGDPSVASMPDYSPDQLEFMQAYDSFRQTTGRRFPTLCETLEVLKSLGYAKPAARKLKLV